ncbi:alpha/beta fold hydrolase [Alkalimarinus sediminis]|uniref:Alpha/beta hydrolase n=1 Tax=Alkalimarinus sediminis TaxID=1632866 RepID=A0A9E8HIX6_9ALTE|nr:alpha/beta hydrolase [Alkalimarinus sediminis]UZW75523.1 alpha/beta hydrolase [Alkalimarinus sediminis]
MAYIPLRDGEQLYIRCIGRGQPVVLLHGFGSQSSHWIPNILPLIHRYKFILPDLRGFGHSHHLPMSNADVFGHYAEDIEDLFNHFQLDNAILGGISTGAYACLAFNQIGGFERVSRYLNIEHSAQSRNSDDWSHGLFGSRQDEIFSHFRELLKDIEHLAPDISYWSLPEHTRLKMRDTVIALISRATNRPMTRSFIRFAGRYFERPLTKTLIKVEHWQAYLRIMEAFMAGKDTRAHLANIQIPTTLMIGEQSRYFPLSGQLDVCRYVPHAKVIRFKKSGHIPILDEPIKFQREFMRFLRGNDT